MSSRDVDRDIQRIREAHWDRILELSIKARKRLLLVEGDDDKSVIEQLLESVDQLWVSRVYVGVAGDRDKVLRKLEKNPDWYGLVDRDVWDDEDIARKRAALPNLEVTEGWCLENHFCDPGALESALSLSAGAVQAVLDAELDGWLGYGAIWWTLQRLREGFSAVLPPSDLGHPQKDPCLPWRDEGAFLERLRPYGDRLRTMDVDRVVREIRARKTALDALAAGERLAKGVHGKRFFLRGDRACAQRGERAAIRGGVAPSRGPPLERQVAGLPRELRKALAVKAPSGAG
ncbi:hypothetical protein [Sorangium sp. So ce131]|uniref:hypothetical protein n=1 Tax=Sorangium sp. So ce131 TaxID=3133282 RepID=UPI003F610BD6